MFSSLRIISLTLEMALALSVSFVIIVKFLNGCLFGISTFSLIFLTDFIIFLASSISFSKFVLIKFSSASG